MKIKKIKHKLRKHTHLDWSNLMSLNRRFCDMRYFSSDSFSSSEFLELLRFPTKRQNPKEE